MTAAVTEFATPRSTLTRVDCDVCGRDVTVTRNGVIRVHRSMRINPAGKAYVADDECDGGGWPVTWPEGATA